MFWSQTILSDFSSIWSHSTKNLRSCPEKKFQSLMNLKFSLGFHYQIFLSDHFSTQQLRSFIWQLFIGHPLKFSWLEFKYFFLCHKALSKSHSAPHKTKTHSYTKQKESWRWPEFYVEKLFPWNRKPTDENPK